MAANAFGTLPMAFLSQTINNFLERLTRPGGKTARRLSVQSKSPELPSAEDAHARDDAPNITRRIAARVLVQRAFTTQFEYSDRCFRQTRALSLKPCLSANS